MVIKFKRIVVLLFIAMATIFGTCKKGGLGCANTVYNFKIGMAVYPDNSMILIGDTIWFELDVPTNFTDVVSNKTINYSDAKNLGTVIGFVNYSIVNNPISAADSFSTVLLKGTKVDNPHKDQIREYLFDEQNGRYVFKLGVIAERKGIYGVGVGNAQNVFRNLDKCTKAFFNIFLQNTNQHYYLNPNINSSNTDTTQASGTYYFKVN